MNAPLWVFEAALQFWAAAGDPEPYPRSLARLIPRALPASVRPLPHLRVVAVHEWLARRFGTGIAGVADRPLRACLVARNGHGFIFVDETDPDDEQRFSVAHELAHFLREYWQPRER